MTTVHVANVTQQYRVLSYKLPENPKVMSQTIPPGQQVILRGRPGGFGPEDVKAFVQQNEPYGLVKADEVGKRQGVSIGLVWSEDRPLTRAILLRQIRQNEEVMIARGKQARSAAAIASDERINSQLSEITGNNVMQKLTFEVEQKTPARVVNEGYDNVELARQLAESPSIGEGIRVDATAEVSKRGRR